MRKIILFQFFLLFAIATNANTIIVKNADELKKANKEAKPGDQIILQNGEWNNITIKLNCNGTKEMPVTFKAETTGKVKITGNSKLLIGGNYIVIEGLLFTEGYAGDDAIIKFRVNKEELANNCRVTNTVIDGFNNPKRMDENHWIELYGKNNRLDHCSFLDKKNMGVLLAVILDDERSRENFHRIDHNHFGYRLPLASNTGEILRVGVSQHCEFNSNTQITDNFFEYCDGETEIISIKSGSNIVKGNVFKECQGSVVLRHGNFNTVENNIFLGNGKAGTGGVRVINKGQWVINNYFYKCRGIDFRSPLSIMNGIPNSPANRYVQVTDAVIANNTFTDCTSASFCEGSDLERSLPPSNVIIFNNIFYNNTDSIIYKIFDDISGIKFWGNEVTTSLKQNLLGGFRKTSFAIQNNSVAPLPVTLTKGAVQLPDSIRKAAFLRLGHSLSTRPGFANAKVLKMIYTGATTGTGAVWYKQMKNTQPTKPILVYCSSADEVYQQLAKKEPVTINLAGKNYTLNRPFLINKTVQFIGNLNTTINLSTEKMMAVFVVEGNGNLSIQNLLINGENVTATHLISSDSSGSSNHYNLTVKNCTIKNLDRKNGCENIFYAYKYMTADSIIISSNSFHNNNSNGIIMAEEKDDKGYYNAEKILISHNKFSSQAGTLLNIYRGGNDESTMGPNLLFSHNKIENCNAGENSPLISFTGVQVTKIFTNTFHSCNNGNVLIRYKDIVRARHSLEHNTLINSGSFEKNEYVTEKENNISNKK